MPSVRIVADERERKSQVPELIKEAGGSVDFAQLPVGDYIVSTEQVVERKTVSDLVGSIYDGRLFIQCSQLVKHFQKPVILVQGDIADLDLIPPDASEQKAKRLSERLPLAYDALATVMMEFSIAVIHVPSAKHAANFLMILAGRELKDGKASGPLLRKIKKENPVLLQQLSVLSSIPGVGEKLAARMLKKFVTPQRAMTASAAELATIPGFGLARAERIRKILDSPGSQNPVIQRTLFDL